MRSTASTSRRIPNPITKADSGYERAGELVTELLDHFDPEVDFSRFDNDKDGKVEAVSIVYAGSGVTFAQGLWPMRAGSTRNATACN